MPTIIWTDYMQYRVMQRGFDLAKIEEILKYSKERYYDTATGRIIAVGHHDKYLVMIPYEYTSDEIIPVTIHTTTRQQIRFRLKSGRFIINE